MGIKEICLIYNVKYKDLAKMLGVPYTTMRQWYEKERRTPNYIIKYAKLYLDLKGITNE